jgi:hypothetical protein
MKNNKFTLLNPEIRIEPTNMCNAKCIMCPREKMKRSQGVLDINLYKQIVDQSVDAGARKISLENFGETFLDPYIFERAEYAKTKGLDTLTITNASLLDEEKSRKALDLFDVIRISMYGMTKETFEKIHNGLQFEKVRDNVDRLFAMRQKATHSKTRIQIYFLLMDENKHEVRDFLDKYEKISAGVAIWKPHNWGDGRIYREGLGKKVSCGRPLTGPLQVQWDGMVVPCCFDYDSRMILGDLNKQTLEEVFRGEEYNKIRIAHKENDFSKFPFCYVCDQLNKREDVLIYTNIKHAKVGATNTTYFDLKK